MKEQEPQVTKNRFGGVKVFMDFHIANLKYPEFFKPSRLCPPSSLCNLYPPRADYYF